MTKLKMGMHNRITAERFHIIKAALAEGESESAVMAKYKIKSTTLKYIEKSVNFYEYRLYTETLPAARKMPTVIAPSSGLAFEDFSYKRKNSKKQKTSNVLIVQAKEDEKRAKEIKVIYRILIAILSTLALLITAFMDMYLRANK